MALGTFEKTVSSLRVSTENVSLLACDSEKLSLSAHETKAHTANNNQKQGFIIFIIT